MFQDDPNIYIPAVYEEYTTRRVLVLEWIDGIKINDYTGLEAAGIDRLEVANRTVQAYFHQFFTEGFFHADPHPGNIFVKRGTPGNGPIIHSCVCQRILAAIAQNRVGDATALNTVGRWTRDHSDR